MIVIREISRKIEEAEENAADCWAHMLKYNRDPVFWGRLATSWEESAEVLREEARDVWGWYLV